MPVDIALVYDPVMRRADLAFDGRDFVLDGTPLTALLIAVGSDRRAHADDVLPETIDNPQRPPSLVARRGWAGDALDAQGRRIGSRLWTLRREKYTEAVRQRAESILAEAVDQVAASWGVATQITVRWVARGVLGYVVRAGATTVQLQNTVGG